MTKLCLDVWSNGDLYKEDVNLKKKWYVRNGQDIDKSCKYEKAMMYLKVVKDKKRVVTYGPVVQVAVGPYQKGKGSRAIDLQALMFLVIKDGGFVSVVVLEENLDLELLVQADNDEVVKELENMIENNAFTNDWFQSFVSDCEPILLPLVKKICLAKNMAVKPLILKLNKNGQGSESGTPSSSTTRPPGVERAVVVSNLVPEASAGQSGVGSRPGETAQPKPLSAVEPEVAKAGTSAGGSHDTTSTKEVSQFQMLIQSRDGYPRFVSELELQCIFQYLLITFPRFVSCFEYICEY